eukprot:6309196-Amphidinium_carterae.1
MRTQDCRPLKTKKTRRGPLVSWRRHKLPVRAARPLLAKAQLVLFFLRTKCVLATGPLRLRSPVTGSQPLGGPQAGGTTPPEAAASGFTGAAGSCIFPILRKRPRAPD